MTFYHELGERPYVISCRIFGGRSPLTGKGVGERHRWSEGGGKGRCEFCGRYKDDVTTKPRPAPMSLDEAIERGAASAAAQAPREPS